MKQVILRTLLGTLGLLLIPIIAMQFNEEMVWTFFDFVIVGILLFTSGFVYGVVTRKAGSVAYKAAVALSVGIALILTWVNLAVGIIGNEGHPANLLYIVMLIIGFVSAVIVRFRAERMVRVLYGLAIAQLLVPVIALSVWRPEVTVGVVQVFGINAFFSILWISSALLFRRAATTEIL